VILAGTLFTLFVLPVAYDLLARSNGLPGDAARGWSGRRAWRRRLPPGVP